MKDQHPAERPEDMASMEDMLAMSGLEFMQAVKDGRLPGPPISRTLNFRLERVEKGLVVFTGTPQFAAMNPLGTVHGGWYGAILDSAMSCAVHSALPKGRTYTTLEYKVNILRSIRQGLRVLATGTLQHAGRSTGIARGEITGAEDGKLYATGSVTCIIIQV